MDPTRKSGSHRPARFYEGRRIDDAYALNRLFVACRPSRLHDPQRSLEEQPELSWKRRDNTRCVDRICSVGDPNVRWRQSMCFWRAPENLTRHDLRRYILDLCAADPNFPKEFAYLRSVGRCLTKVKAQQEQQLKVKNYRPPTVRTLTKCARQITDLDFPFLDVCTRGEFAVVVAQGLLSLVIQIFILDESHNDGSSTVDHSDLALSRESPMNSQLWKAAVQEPSTALKL